MFYIIISIYIYDKMTRNRTHLVKQDENNIYNGIMVSTNL